MIKSTEVSDLNHLATGPPIEMVKRYRLKKNFNRKCDPDVHVNVNVNADDRGDNNSSMHFVQAS